MNWYHLFNNFHYTLPPTVLYLYQAFVRPTTYRYILISSTRYYYRGIVCLSVCSVLNKTKKKRKGWRLSYYIGGKSFLHIFIGRRQPRSSEWRHASKHNKRVPCVHYLAPHNHNPLLIDLYSNDKYTIIINDTRCFSLYFCKKSQKKPTTQTT